MRDFKERQGRLESSWLSGSASCELRLADFIAAAFFSQTEDEAVAHFLKTSNKRKSGS